MIRNENLKKRNENLLKSRVGQIDCGDEREEGVKSGLQNFNLGI